MGTFNRFVPPPPPADAKAFDALVLQWTPYCERWAETRERRYPGVDFGSAANLTLWKAAATFNPDGPASFYGYLTRGLRWWAATASRTERRRSKVLKRQAFDEDCPGSRTGETEQIDAAIDAPVYMGRLDRLPARQATAFRAWALDGRTCRDVASELECSHQHVLNMARDASAVLAVPTPHAA